MTLLFSNLGLPEHARPLARLINDYDHYLSLERLPDGHEWLKANPDKPYAVWHRHPGLTPYIIESFPESMLDHRIMAVILQGDAEKHGWDMSKFDPIGATAMLLEGRKREDEMAAANDLMAFKQNRLHDTGKRLY